MWLGVIEVDSFVMFEYSDKFYPLWFQSSVELLIPNCTRVIIELYDGFSNVANSTIYAVFRHSMSSP